ncbi:MAG: AAA family ATPase [Bacteroidia bacterium]
MQPESIIRIAFIGPESTGKTTLCKSLTEYFKTVCVPEYAREYMEKLNRPYTLNDILITSKEQLLLEEKLIVKANRFIFSDTELITAKIWCEDVFETCPNWILEKIIETQYDLYLLTMPDLPWRYDPVRENPQRRAHFFNLYKNELETRNFEHEIISGVGDARFQNVLNFIQKHFSEQEE